jgi:hypothetical protein
MFHDLSLVGKSSLTVKMFLEDYPDFAGSGVEQIAGSVFVVTGLFL